MNTTFWSEIPKERHHLEDLIVDERLILKWILNKLNWSLWIGLIWLRLGTTGERPCAHDNEPSSSTEFLGLLGTVSNYNLLKEDPAPWW
jgi:hypothetical protein